jgi:hypothetical protein
MALPINSFKGFKRISFVAAIVYKSFLVTASNFILCELSKLLSFNKSIAGGLYHIHEADF